MRVIGRVDPGARTALRADVVRFVQRVRNVVELEKAILHGSIVGGWFHEGSDIDLVLVGDFHQRFHLRPAPLLDLNDDLLPLDILCYRPEEWEAMATGSFSRLVRERGEELPLDAPAPPRK